MCEDAIKPGPLMARRARHDEKGCDRQRAQVVSEHPWDEYRHPVDSPCAQGAHCPPDRHVPGAEDLRRNGRRDRRAIRRNGLHQCFDGVEGDAAAGRDQSGARTASAEAGEALHQGLLVGTRQAWDAGIERMRTARFLIKRRPVRLGQRCQNVRNPRFSADALATLRGQYAKRTVCGGGGASRRFNCSSSMVIRVGMRRFLVMLVHGVGPASHGLARRSRYRARRFQACA